ncbi:zinc-binding protein [Clostridium perfringens]|uniref:zinc-binding protein n=1 Tax=Clostridium perfringens TaxID=1502 RepID=UPI002247BC35|nr:zinc-binding protein [Clostridium perfringens]MCX0403271.1 zinc-binding protein [Clostridium perfringens]
MKIQKEYERLKNLFDGIDENNLSLLDGSLMECARLKVELDDLHEIVKETGLIKFNPNNMSQQKELPVSKLITKVRANYLSYVSRLSGILGKNILDDEEDELAGYE